jgi:hypothetical protein
MESISHLGMRVEAQACRESFGLIAGCSCELQALFCRLASHKEKIEIVGYPADFSFYVVIFSCIMRQVFCCLSLNFLGSVHIHSTAGQRPTPL